MIRRNKQRHEDRLRKNDESRNRAEHHAEEWTVDELDLLFSEWDKSSIEDIAAVLGRTIEACREKFYKTRRGVSRTVTSKTTTTTTTCSKVEERYIGSQDDPEDQYWSPDYYTNNNGK